MKTRIAAGIAAASLALVALTACSATEAGPDNAAPAASSETTPSAEISGFALTTFESPLGTIVVDGEEKVVYQFDKDTQGGDASACVDQCAMNWPAVPGGESAPELDGVTGEIGTITGVNGEPQLTLNGWPLYYFAGDEAAGDTKGQGVSDVWWVLSPAGEPIKG